MYKYKGNEYIVLFEAEMKNTETRVWQPCVIYQAVKTEKRYVRESVDFYYLFKKL